MDIKIIQENYNKDDYAYLGTKFLIGNGYMGIRGTLEEYTKEHMCAVNIAGVYNQSRSDAWRESLNAPNPFFAKVIIDSLELALPAVENKVKSHAQSLDLATGMHVRQTIFETPKGTATIKSERFAGMDNVDTLGLKYSVTVEFDGEITIITGIDGDVWDINGPHFIKHEVMESIGVLSVKGICADGIYALTREKLITFGNLVSSRIIKEDKKVFHKLIFATKKGESIGFEKVAVVGTSVDEKIAKTKTPPSGSILSKSYEELLEAQKKYWSRFWKQNFITIEGDDKAQTALNFSIYSLQIIAPRHARALSIPARGLSGQVYKGAVFWDTEMFMLDYFLMNDPNTARTLLTYRIDGLKGALDKAKREGFDGAFYAWESHEDGIEACTKYNVTDVFTGRPVRTYFNDKQIHISAAIVYGFDKYIKATSDYSILDEGGFEVILECAKFFMSRLVQRYSHREDSDRKSALEIHDVVGPDEYHERVSNNAYTNRMARFVLETAYQMLKNHPKRQEYSEVFKKLSKSKNKICMPRIKNDVIEQFDGYFDLEDISVDEVRGRLKNEREYWGGDHGVASSTQVIKQADVVTMLAMFKDEYDAGTLIKNLDYYQKRTEHGSSLSACMYGLLSCYCGRPDDAYPMFLKSADVDLKPPSKLWAGGIYIGGSHPASAGGAYLMAIKGFAGLTHNKKGVPKLAPKLPKHWTRLAFKCEIFGRKYQVEITQKEHSVKEIC